MAEDYSKIDNKYDNFLERTGNLTYVFGDQSPNANQSVGSGNVNGTTQTEDTPTKNKDI